MTSYSLAGRIVRSTDYEPVVGAQIRLSGAASTLSGVDGAVPLDGPLESWTRTVSGLSGDLYDGWEAYAKDIMPWPEFRAAARDFNPHLDADEPRFDEQLSYVLPERDETPRMQVTTTSDEHGRYRIEIGGQPFSGELLVEAPGYDSQTIPVIVNGAVTQSAALNPLLRVQSSALLGEQTPIPAGAPGSVRSALPNYEQLPDQIKLLITWGLFMLGDDQQVFNTLPANLQKLCYGARFVNDPAHRNHKDICCADLVSVALTAAGFDIDWPSKWGKSAAQFYWPEGNDKLVEVTDPNDWLPGDVMIFGPHKSDSARQVGHVNLYVGQFVGTDRSGVQYAPGGKFEVIDASIDFPGKDGKEMGTSVKGRDVANYCIAKKCWVYSWVRRVRLREVAGVMGR